MWLTQQVRRAGKSGCQKEPTSVRDPELHLGRRPSWVRMVPRERPLLCQGHTPLGTKGCQVTLTPITWLVIFRQSQWQSSSVLFFSLKYSTLISQHSTEEEKLFKVLTPCGGNALLLKVIYIQGVLHFNNPFKNKHCLPKLAICL